MEKAAAAVIIKETESPAAPQSPLKKIPRTVSTGSVTPTPSKKRKSTSLPQETVDYLKNWIMSPEHIAHPYPTEQEKAQIMKDTGIELKQLTNWFVNNRKRYWKPRVEARLREQQKAGKLVKRISSTSLEDCTQSPAVRPPSVTPVASPSRVMVRAPQSGVVSSGDEEEPPESCSCTETIQIHILRPVSDAPSLQDVTVLPNIPMERILRTYGDCLLTYRYAPSDDAKKVCVLLSCVLHCCLIESHSHTISNLTKKKHRCSEGEMRKLFV